MSLGRKSEIGMTIIVLVIIGLLFLGWYINIGQRECRSNNDCSLESYCGSDFSCHSYPAIQKTVVEYSLIFPSIIIGIAIVIAALIFRRRSPSSSKSREEHRIPGESGAEYKEYSIEDQVIPQEVDAIIEPYYQSYKNDGSPKVP